MKRFCLFLALCFLMAMPAARAEDTLDEFLREADSILDRLENQYAMQHLAMDAVSSIFPMPPPRNLRPWDWRVHWIPC